VGDRNCLFARLQIKETAMKMHRWLSIAATIGLLIGIFPMAGAGSVARAEDSHFFPETGHTVKGLFLTYWNTHGGLAQQGYPISEELQEQSDTDGKTYTMQYFERAVFEMHPENQPPFNVLLSLLGVFYYNEKYSGNAPNQHTSTDNPRLFSETGKTVGGTFRRYWETHGGLAQQGYPISNEFQEVSQTDGKTYTVQYFQRAVFEEHPEFAGTSNEVLLSLLGVFYYNKRHGGAPQPTPTIAPNATPIPTATPTPKPVEPSGQVLLLNGGGVGQPMIIDQQGTLFKQQTFNLGSQGWTHVASTEGGYFDIYKQSGLCDTAQVKPDGSFNQLTQFPCRAGRTSVTSPGGNIVELFDSSTKVLDAVPIDSKGIVGPPVTNVLGTPYADVIGGYGGHIFFYLDSPQIDGFVHYMTAVVDTGGHLTNMVPVTQRPRAGDNRRWKAISYIDDTHIFFYNPVTGQYAVWEIKTDGTAVGGTARPFGLGWTGFALVQKNGRFIGNHSLLLAYRLDTGAAMTATFDDTFNVANLKTYQGANALPPGSIILSAVR
jgi:hypothetical protein